MDDPNLPTRNDYLERKVVCRIDFTKYTRSEAITRARRLGYRAGIDYHEIIPTARFWVFRKHLT